MFENFASCVLPCIKSYIL